MRARYPEAPGIGGDANAYGSDDISRMRGCNEGNANFPDTVNFLSSPTASGNLMLAMLVVMCVLLLQDLLQSCACGGGRRVEDMCYERRRAEACVDASAHHALGPVRNPVL